MSSVTSAADPAPGPATEPAQDPALRYVLAVGAVSAGLSLTDISDTGLSSSVVTEAQARRLARSWGIEPAGGPGDGPGTVIVLVDGLGLEMLRQRRGHTPTLRRWLVQGYDGDGSDDNNSTGILTCRPSTTAAALTTLGTSALPGTTGMVGYSVLRPGLGPALPASTVPSSAQVLSLITWQGDDAPSPRSWQDVPTIFERITGGSAVSIGPARFAGSGLTEAALRGAEHRGADRMEDRPGLAAGALHRGTPLVYLYVGELDHTGHKHGWRSPQWLAQLERLDAAMAGEPRLTHLHVAGGNADLAAEVAHRYRQVLGERAAWIGTREQAAEHLGALSPRTRGVVGDVVVAMAGTWVLVDPRVHSEPAIAMPGVHGSFTPAETRVPLLVTEA